MPTPVAKGPDKRSACSSAMACRGRRRPRYRDRHECPSSRRSRWWRAASSSRARVSGGLDRLFASRPPGCIIPAFQGARFVATPDMASPGRAAPARGVSRWMPTGLAVQPTVPRPSRSCPTRGDYQSHAPTPSPFPPPIQLPFTAAMIVMVSSVEGLQHLPGSASPTCCPRARPPPSCRPFPLRPRIAAGRSQ